MEKIIKKKQTALSAEKFFTFKVRVLIEGKFLGSSLFVAHDTREAKCMMIGKLTDSFQILNDNIIDFEVEIFE